jgi:hypothetical protein
VICVGFPHLQMCIVSSIRVLLMHIISRNELQICCIEKCPLRDVGYRRQFRILIVLSFQPTLFLVSPSYPSLLVSELYGAASSVSFENSEINICCS